MEFQLWCSWCAGSKLKLLDFLGQLQLDLSDEEVGILQFWRRGGDGGYPGLDTFDF